MFVGSILVFILLLVILGLPLWKDLKKNTKEASETKIQLTLLKEKLENLKKLSEKEAEIKEKNAKVLAALPEDKDISRLFVQFENIATQSGLSVSQVSEGGATAATDGTAPDQTSLIIPVTYQVTATANDYASLKTALSSFEKALRLVSIDDFSATKGDPGINLNFNITTYKRGAK